MTYFRKRPDYPYGVWMKNHEICAAQRAGPNNMSTTPLPSVKDFGGAIWLNPLMAQDIMVQLSRNTPSSCTRAAYVDDEGQRMSSLSPSSRCNMLIGRLGGLYTNMMRCNTKQSHPKEPLKPVDLHRYIGTRIL